MDTAAPPLRICANVRRDWTFADVRDRSYGGLT
jgi:hypothetical protein